MRATEQKLRNLRASAADPELTYERERTEQEQKKEK